MQAPIRRLWGTQSACSSGIIWRTGCRSLVYMRSSETRVRGMKKDEQSYLKVNGVLYPGDGSTLEPVKRFLGADYMLPDPIILQTITHKSFAHGFKPYNENLSILGRHFLRLHTSIHTSGHKTSNPTAVNGYNFDVTFADINNLLTSSAATSEVCRQTGIDKTIFWKKRAENLPPQQSGEITIQAKTIDAIVGAILMTLGGTKAKAFVNQKLLSGPNSLIDISSRLYKS